MGEIGIMRGYKPYPWGPRNEADLLLAIKETGVDGYISGGPQTPAEWYHWNAAILAGWSGRYPLHLEPVEILKEKT